MARADIFSVTWRVIRIFEPKIIRICSSCCCSPPVSLPGRLIWWARKTPFHFGLLSRWHSWRGLESHRRRQVPAWHSGRPSSEAESGRTREKGKGADIYSDSSGALRIGVLQVTHASVSIAWRPNLWRRHSDGFSFKFHEGKTPPPFESSLFDHGLFGVESTPPS